MSDRFDFEQQIQKCWLVTDDIRDISEFILEYPSADFTKDRACNALNGLADLYEVKFNKLWDLFEEVHMNLVRDEMMAREECAALREQLEGAYDGQGYGAGGKPTNQGAGFGIAAIKANKVNGK
jgi:hypothetical protein